VQSIIAYRVPTADGYSGHISTLTIRRQIRILANEQTDKQHAPDFKLFCGDFEVGAAWKAQSKSGQAYLSIQPDDPSWPALLRAKLFEKSGFARLVWNRKSGVS
jgi:uncharacterized protein (DUF736 family)